MVCQSWHGQSKLWGDNSMVSSSWLWQQLQHLWATLQATLQAVSHPSGEEQSPGQGWVAAPLATRGFAAVSPTSLQGRLWGWIEGSCQGALHVCLWNNVGVQWALSPLPRTLHPHAGLDDVSTRSCQLMPSCLGETLCYPEDHVLISICRKLHVGVILISAA